MKKLLTLLSLTLSMTAFANNFVESNTMQINATVVRPLTVKHNGNITFGKVVQNTTVIENGKQFIISGTPGQKVTFTMNDTPINAFTQTNLVNEDDSEKQMTVYLKNISLSSASSLNDEGNLTWGFDAEMYIPQGQTTGNYSGQLVAKVTYE